MNTRVDLPRLSRPQIPGLLKDQKECLDEIVSDLAAEGLDLTSSGAADPAYRVASALALREALLRQKIYDTVLDLHLAYASGDALDLIGATYYSTARQEGEADDAYRQRLASAYEGLASGLSGGWYEHHALAVDGVAGVLFHSPTPGNVTVAILAREDLLDASGSPLYADGLADEALRSEVLAALTAPYVRQQTDKVAVVSATNLDVSVQASLKLFAEPDTEIALTDARKSLENLARRRRGIGRGITKAAIAGAVINAGVSDADITLRPVNGLDAAGDPQYGEEADEIEASNTQALRISELSVEASSG